VLGSPYPIRQGSLTDALNPNYLITFTDGYLTIVPGSVVPDDRALQLALIQSAQEWLVPACLPVRAEGMPGVFAIEQRRLDRASGGIRVGSGSMCRATPL
jgi:threonine/homoserine/homoserine lactone efflux protein